MPASASFDLPPALVAYCERSTVALTIAAAEVDDMPLVYANTRFLNLTGYTAEQVLDRNCRFLQGAETTAQERAEVAAFVREPAQVSGRFVIHNRRANGDPFLNFLFMTRLRDRDGKTVLILGSQFDLTKAAGRSAIDTNEAALTRGLSDIEAISRGFGMAMIGSAKVMADSVSTLATAIWRDA